jgi:alpha-galactosidase
MSDHRIIPDPSKFPDGISGVAEQVHRLGLKIGLYSSRFAFYKQTRWSIPDLS